MGDLGWMLAFAQFKDSDLLVWPHAVMPEDEADAFECRITMSNAECATSVRSPVYSVDRSR